MTEEQKKAIESLKRALIKVKKAKLGLVGVDDSLYVVDKEEYLEESKYNLHLSIPELLEDVTHEYLSDASYLESGGA